MFGKIVDDIERSTREESVCKLIGVFYKMQQPDFQPNSDFFDDHKLIYEFLIILVKHFSGDRVKHLFKTLHKHVKDAEDNSIFGFAMDNHVAWRQNCDLVLEFNWDYLLLTEIPTSAEKIKYLQSKDLNDFDFFVHDNKKYIDWLVDQI